MKKLLLLAVCVAASLGASSQTIAAFITDNSATNLRSAPSGKVVMKLPNNTSYIVVLSSPSNGWWKVDEVENAEEGTDIMLKGSPTRKYWIHHSVVGYGTRNYGGERWCLRAAPSAKAKAAYWFKEEIILHPIDVKGKWVKVTTSDKKHTGWIEDDKLCGNPLTNCC